MGEGSGMATETHDERSYESFSHAEHDTPFLPLSFSLFLLPTFSVVLLQSVRDAHIFTSP